MFSRWMCSPRRASLKRYAEYALALGAILLMALPASAKDTGLAGVMVYPGPDGMAYVQFTGLLINGKLEFRACGPPTLNKNIYNHLPKEAAVGLKSLERMPDGSLQAEFGNETAKCVLPSEFKYDKDASMSQADVIDRSSFTAQVTGSQPPGVTAFPALSPGSKIYFVSPSDVELAEYLRAQRAATIAQWRAYLAQYGTAPHAPAAKKSLEALLLQDGQQQLAAYQKTKPNAPGYAHLKTASQRAYEVFALEPDQSDAQKLQADVDTELTQLCDTGSAQLALYRAALASHTKGYKSLVTAKSLADATFDVDPKFPAALALHKETTLEWTALDTDLKTAQARLTAQHYDDAYAAARKYLSFLEEEDRVTAIVQADYKFHMDRGAEFASTDKWADAVGEYTRANEIAPSDASKAALAQAQSGQSTQQDKEAAESASVKSKAYTDAQDPIQAYEVLAALTPAQQKLVADAMEAAQPAYIAAATDKAHKLQQSHTPIKGRGDEDAVREAYAYLERLDTLSDDPDVKVRLDLLSDAISVYYVEVAKKYIDRPVASGVGLGWSYLGEASHYKPGLDTIRDEMAKASSTYQMRSKLSVGVVFRDQTSRRDSIGFAEQLQDAIATGLETSKLPVKVIRPSAAGAGNATGQALDPNYQLVGEILQHRTIRNIKNETLQSKYRFGEREIPNAAWNAADQAYQDAETAVDKAQNDIRAAEAKKNKKQTEQANAELANAQKQASEARAKENTIPKSQQEDVIRPYSYTKQTIDINNIVELSFRIVDTSGNIVEESKHVIKETPKTFTVLQNLKPEDTEGVRDMDAPPDETQLMTDVEIAARDELVKLAYGEIADLPTKILATARAKVKSEDTDAAAELYILYLNCTPAGDTPERLEAIQFLKDTYNIRHAAMLSASAQ